MLGGVDPGGVGVGHVVGVDEHPAGPQHIGELGVQRAQLAGAQPVQGGGGEHGVVRLVRELLGPPLVAQVGGDEGDPVIALEGAARDGQEALDKADLERPDLIFLDVLMPRLDGFQTCRALRARADMKDVPIILVTTRSEPHYVRQGFESGCTDYITKPFNGEELLAKVRDHLEGAHP